MAHIPLTITNAARIALATAAIPGNPKVQIDKMRFGTGRYVPDADAVGIMAPFAPVKEFDDPAGSAAGSTFQFVINEPSVDIYNIGEIGIYAGNLLFGISSRPSDESWLLEKGARPLIVTAAYTFANVTAANIVFNVANTHPLASEDVAGMIELSDVFETILDTTDNMAISPKQAIAALLSWITPHLATRPQAVAGSLNNVLMTPLRVAEAVTADIAFMIASMAEAIAGINNTHVMSPLRTKEHIDGRIASQSEAESGLASSKLMAPLRVAQYITNRLVTLSQAQNGTNTTRLMTSSRTRSQITSRLASRSEAENASDNNKLMTALRTRESNASWWNGTNVSANKITSGILDRARIPITESDDAPTNADGINGDWWMEY